ncbi:DUF1343 domain-containing protein [Thalassotalea sp. G2M2-11]|uniref:exo-beta-N-acetylmuramidase NamZ family protein n=1 Tax=Thalassotalea sp. G2M2-11 TaxID=2787627 RepID=UPI0019CFDB1B|nr:DUF1343 domain-containing protein [Thalassotalea sp. G2M2-11]
MKLMILLPLLLWLPLLSAKNIAPSQVGAEQVQRYLPRLINKKVGLVVNQSSRAKGKHLVDLLHENNITISKIFAPEHGFRGKKDAGEVFNSSKDEQTGIDIVSIYGKNKKPSTKVLTELDVIIFDIQDVGVRFYTYINSMFYMMQAAAQHDIEFIVLDRPNPNIAYVDGPMLDDKFRSFVGLLPIPLIHGMTVGELAKMIVGEGWLDTIENPNNIKHKLNLQVVKVLDYSRADHYDLPVLPSPNLPNSTAIRLYPSLCFFEATPVSVGRGTDFPFQVLGHDTLAIGDFEFTPRSIVGAASNPKLKGKKLTGMDLRASQISGFDLSLFYQWYQLFAQHDNEFFQRAQFLDKLAGTDQIRLDMLAGKSLAAITAKWQNGLAAFNAQRQPYLLYPANKQ